MKLKNKDGEQFDLSPETSIEIERTNPFFIDWGEQSLPITLPPTVKNKRLLGQVQHVAGRQRIRKVDVYLHEQVFNVKAKMILLSYNERDGFECSLLLNEGSLNNRVQGVSIADVFGDETVRFASVGECVDFLRSLWKTEDERFSIFQISSVPDENGKCTNLNIVTLEKLPDGYYDLMNRNESVEVLDEKSINIPAGCYITPFVKVNYLLKRVFKYLGYTFEPGFFSIPPFANMVVLNNTADTIVNASIRFTDILPDCSIGTLLNIFRKKFCMEFAVDDVGRKVTVLLFNEILDSISKQDLTGIMVGKAAISYPENYRQLKLHADCIPHVLVSSNDYRKSVQIDADQSDYVSLKNLYPDALLDRNSGTIYRLGFKGHKAIIDGVGSLNTDYYTGGSLQAEEIECEECLPGMTCAKAINGVTLWDSHPVVDKVRFLHTRVVMDNEENNVDDTESSTGGADVSDTDSLPVMLTFTGRIAGRGRDIGATSNYYYDNKLFDYTLFWNGPDGLFEKFWRGYDSILRNSMHKVSTDLILSEADKMQLSSTGKIIMDGQELIPETIRYVVGKHEVSTSDFYTIAKHEPISVAPEQTWPRIPKYTWQIHYEIYPSRRYATYNVEPETVYYAPPTETEYKAGGQYYRQIFQASVGNEKNESGTITDAIDGTVTVWLEPILTSFPL